jgi:hypothetical protein
MARPRHEANARQERSFRRDANLVVSEDIRAVFVYNSDLHAAARAVG